MTCLQICDNWQFLLLSAQTYMKSQVLKSIVFLYRCNWLMLPRWMISTHIISIMAHNLWFHTTTMTRRSCSSVARWAMYKKWRCERYYSVWHWYFIKIYILLHSTSIDFQGSRIINMFEVCYDSPYLLPLTPYMAPVIGQAIAFHNKRRLLSFYASMIAKCKTRVSRFDRIAFPTITLTSSSTH